MSHVQKLLLGGEGAAQQMQTLRDRERSLSGGGGGGGGRDEVAAAAVAAAGDAAAAWRHGQDKTGQWDIGRAGGSSSDSSSGVMRMGGRLKDLFEGRSWGGPRHQKARLPVSSAMLQGLTVPRDDASPPFALESPPRR